MKLKITQKDGTIIEAEGTAEELEKIAKAVAPVTFSFAPQPITVPIWTPPITIQPNPTYPNPITQPDVIWGPNPNGDSTTGPRPVQVPSVWSYGDHAPSFEPKFEVKPVCRLPGMPPAYTFTKVC